MYFVKQTVNAFSITTGCYLSKKEATYEEEEPWLLHQDNASGHSALSVQQFLDDTQILVLKHPPYSLTRFGSH